MSNISTCANGQGMVIIGGFWRCGDIGSDTSASTECSGLQFLNGDGTCIPYDSGWWSGGTSNLTRTMVTDTGFNLTYVTYAASVGWNSGGESNLTISDVTDACYDIESELTGVLDDNYAPIGTIKDPWVNTTGDRMTGNLSITGTANITQVGEVLFRGNQSAIAANSSGCLIMTAGSTRLDICP